MKDKKAQEEMVGFAFIIIIVSVILIIFLSLTFSKPKTEIESYEVESFVQALLQQTTDCEDYLEHLSVQKLIFRCKGNAICLDGESTCDVLNNTLQELIGKIWQIENRPVKGYVFKIISEQKEFLVISKGNQTSSYKGAVQRLPEKIDISFKAYY